MLRIALAAALLLGAAPAFAQAVSETAAQTLQQNQRVVLYARPAAQAAGVPAAVAPSPATQAPAAAAEAPRPPRRALALAEDQRPVRAR